jgi:suppressor of cytokine signaling 7
MKNKKTKDNDNKNEDKGRKCNSFSASLKQTLCSIFRFRKIASPEHGIQVVQSKVIEEPPLPGSGLPCTEMMGNGCAHAPGSPDHARAPFSRRALPPLPATSPAPHRDADEEEETLLEHNEDPSSQVEPIEELSMDFASSIEKVKDVSIYSKLNTRLLNSIY